MTAAAPGPLPDQGVDVVLRDGSTVLVRPIRPGDREGLRRMYRSLSRRSLELRFGPDISEEALERALAGFLEADGIARAGVVAVSGPAGDLIAHACYERTGPARAEVAFAVADAFQGRGLGTILLGQLAEIGEANGIREFEAFVRPDHHQMIDVLRSSGFPVEMDVRAGAIQALFPTALTEEARARFEQRERLAAIAALTSVFAPRAVAVIGASRRRGTIGGEIFHNLLAYGFTGRVYAVNPAATEVQGQPSFPSIEAVPGPVDLAVIVVPAAALADVAAQCARKGVRALVVISSGFAEIGEAGRQRQARLLEICRASGMRLIGPNCMGILNTDPAVRLNATFAPVEPPAGRVAFMSQSGALGLAIMDYAASLGLGLSSFASVGNKADISGNDLIQYWEDDARTDVILLYLESFGNPRKFSRIARRLGRRKPIVVVKSGRSPAGARATSSHTGALLAASDVTVDALFRQAGVIRTDTLEELFDVAALLANQPAPSGPGVAIVTNSGGPAILCADTAEAEGLVVPVLADEIQARLRALLPAEASVGNPVDMLASATAEQYGQAIRAVAADPGVNAVVAIFIPPMVTRAEDVARSIVAAARELPPGKPLLTVFMSSRGVPEALRAPGVRIPSFAFPEDAAIALARAARYGAWRAQGPSPEPAFPDLQRPRAA
ncbi:MAG TPA: GNAT family N-acetyltransferase, partial [bacterium]|nr:GNAT family N-acetyltransferase [bacterium]